MTNTENKLIGTRRKSLTTLMAALLAGSLVATAGSFAYAKTDGQAFDPAKFEQRVDKALTGTDATADQKKQVAGILENAFKDLKPLRDQRVENRKAMEAALQAPTIDPARIEQIRAEQMKVADKSSQRFTKALTDAGNVLSASQRQAFFKNWSQGRSENHGKRHG
jgi:Spy/CpxP family protein refolding chaperone